MDVKELQKKAIEVQEGWTNLPDLLVGQTSSATPEMVRKQIDNTVNFAAEVRMFLAREKQIKLVAPLEEPVLDKVSVDEKSLREVLCALMGPSHLIRELQVIANLKKIEGTHDPSGSPLNILVKDFNASVDEYNKRLQAYKEATSTKTEPA